MDEAAEPNPVTQRLSVCIVTYRPDLVVLATTLGSLRLALEALGPSAAQVTIIDNSPSDLLSEWLALNFPGFVTTLKVGHGNVGFGRGHNMATLGAQYHLVLNPDVELAPDSLAEALRFLDAHPRCGLLTPLSFAPDGDRQYLCKRFPSLLDLALRGFAPQAVRRLFRARLERYEMRDMPQDAVFWRPPIVSGCFMVFRTAVFAEAGGFDPDYFLYFEDFDLSLRVGRVTDIAFVPTVRIVHGGGHAGRKGAWHVFQFARSAFTFYRKFGVSVI